MQSEMCVGCKDQKCFTEQRLEECQGPWFADLPSGSERKVCGLLNSIFVFSEVITTFPDTIGRPRKYHSTEIVEISNPFLNKVEANG